MFDLDGVEQVRNATSGDKLAQAVFRDCTCTARIRTANENALHGVSGRFAGRAASPSCDGTVEALALKPARVSSGDMHGQLEPACSCFSKLIAGAQQPFAMSGACIVEVYLPWIWLVVGEFVLNEPPLLFGEQPSG